MNRTAAPRASLIRRLLWTLTAVLLLASACAGSDGDSSSGTAPATTPANEAAAADIETPAAAEATAPTTTEAAADDTPADTTEAEPEADEPEPVEDEFEYEFQRIVSISPTGTEIVFAVGAGDRVVAVDEYSYFPPEAPVTDLSGWNPNVEAIASYDPDLVVMHTDGDVIASLEALGIAVLVHDAPITFDDVYAQITQFGEILQQVDQAAQVVSGMQSQIADLVEAAPDGSGLSYFHELDNTLYSVTSGTFIGHVYSLFGLTNVADPADEDGSSYGYPQLSDEYLLDADPDLIFLADIKCCNQSAETVAERPGWDLLSAVRNGRVVELDDDIVSRWGPRLVDFVAAISGALVSIGTGS